MKLENPVYYWFRHFILKGKSIPFLPPSSQNVSYAFSYSVSGFVFSFPVSGPHWYPSPLWSHGTIFGSFSSSGLLGSGVGKFSSSTFSRSPGRGGESHLLYFEYWIVWLNVAEIKKLYNLLIYQHDYDFTTKHIPICTFPCSKRDTQMILRNHCWSHKLHVELEFEFTRYMNNNVNYREMQLKFKNKMQLLNLWQFVATISMGTV